MADVELKQISDLAALHLDDRGMLREECGVSFDNVLASTNAINLPTKPNIGPCSHSLKFILLTWLASKTAWLRDQPSRDQSHQLILDAMEHYHSFINDGLNRGVDNEFNCDDDGAEANEDHDLESADEGRRHPQVGVLGSVGGNGNGPGGGKGKQRAGAIASGKIEEVGALTGPPQQFRDDGVC